MGHRRAALPEQTLRFKPLAAAPADSPGFAELRALNPDVCGWLTLDGTRIDFPVAQGADNMVYVNTDVYGDFSLSGAIFLDSRCPADFTAPYSIVYGHHIEDGGMFGDIVQFTQSDYFAAHTTGTLITDDTAYNIALFACVRADAYDPVLYDPVLYDPAQSPDALLAYIKAHAVPAHPAPKPALPQTADPMPVTLLAALAVLSASGLMGLYYNKYGRKERK